MLNRSLSQIIPITDAMREPHKFPKVLTGVMIGLICQYTSPSTRVLCFDARTLAVLFGGAGVLAYMTFGSEIQTVVLVNLDADSKMVQSVRQTSISCS